MTVLFVVLPLAVVLSGLAAVAFAWAARRGQCVMSMRARSSQANDAAWSR